jgi:hypothetical protein
MAAGNPLSACLLAAALGLAACASQVPAESRPEVTVVPDDPARPRAVRFEVPTALLMGLPGQYDPPLTAQARIASRAIARRELAVRGLCAQGFTGPQGLHFTGDRSRATFTVSCVD